MGRPEPNLDRLSARLISRAHVDLLRVASAACRTLA
jgi:hypothetical protein